jgi:hypothetical protein
VSWTPDKEARHQEYRAESAEAEVERLKQMEMDQTNYLSAEVHKAEARIVELEDILARASRLAESEHAGLTQQVLQEAFGDA